MHNGTSQNGPNGRLLPSGVTLNSHTFYMETHWLVSITVMLQGVCISDQSLKFSAPQAPPPRPKFFKCPHDLWPSSLGKTTILKGKNLMLWDKALIESYFLPTCPGIPRNICLICACHRLLLFWQEKFEVSFSSYKISLCSKLPHFGGATLNNFGCVYLT